MAGVPENPRSRPIWLAAGGLLLLLGLGLVPQLGFRYTLQTASDHLKFEDGVELLRRQLDRAQAWLDWPQLGIDRKRYFLLRGEQLLLQADQAKRLEPMLSLLEASYAAFHQATELDPRDLDGWTGIVRSGERLERLYPFLKKQRWTPSPIIGFERLLQLMPTNLYAVSLLVRYYDSRKMTSERDAMIKRSIFLSPGLYFQLKQQPYYSLALNQELKPILKQAIEQKVFPDQAWRSLSDIYRTEDDYPAAIDAFLRTRPQDGYQDNSSYYMQLGRLQLSAGRTEDAEKSFLRMFQRGNTRAWMQRLDSLFAAYRREKKCGDFIEFSSTLEKRLRAEEKLELLRGECLFEMGQYSLAESHLIRIESGRYQPRALYLQARIAEKLEDWDKMELRSQRATVLEPTNSSYHLLFSRSLQRQKKYQQAEQAATEAIRTSAKPNPWLYNHRAWVRWSKGDLEGAQADWQQAIRILPHYDGLHVNLSRVYERAGNLRAAIREMKQALAKKPGEKKHQERLRQLRQKLKSQPENSGSTP